MKGHGQRAGWGNQGPHVQPVQPGPRPQQGGQQVQARPQQIPARPQQVGPQVPARPQQQVPAQYEPFSYRVYSAADPSQSVAPVAFQTRKGVDPTKKGGFFGIGLVITVVVLIGGASFAGQRLVDAELARSPRVAQAGGTTESAPVTPSPAAAPPFANSLGPTGATGTTGTTGATAATSVVASGSASGSGSALPETTPTTPEAPVVAAASPSAAGVASDSAASRFRRKLQHRRGPGPGPGTAASAAGVLPSERGGGAPPSEAVPPNPF